MVEVVFQDLGYSLEEAATWQRSVGISVRGRTERVAGSHYDPVAETVGGRCYGTAQPMVDGRGNKSAAQLPGSRDFGGALPCCIAFR